MKKIKLIVLAAAGLFSGQAMMAQTIVGTAHDFSGETWNNTGEICIVCHTPHNASTTVTGAPLWNHAVTAVTNYTLYSSTTFNGTSTITQPDGSSKLCLSCHDGTVALENFGGTTGGTHFIGAGFNFGTNLSNDHPISFDYTTALATADGGLKNPASATGIGAGTIQNTMLFGNKMQCASCHDVHNGYGLGNLLVKDNAASALCLTCHSK